MKNKKGFSLIEVVIVIGIIGILMQVGMNSYTGLSSFRSKMEVKKLALDLKNARNLAIATRHKSVVSLGEDSYTIKTKNDTKKYEFPKGLKIVSQNNEGDIIFTPKGRSSSKTARTIIIKSNKKEYVITISPVSGKVNIR